MIISNFQDNAGQWHDRLILEECDYAIFAKGPYADVIDLAKKVAPANKYLIPNALLYPYPERNQDVNTLLTSFRDRFESLKLRFFESVKSGNIVNAIRPDGLYHVTDDDIQSILGEKLLPTATEDTQSNDSTITDYKALLSTRSMLKAIGGNLYYNGPEFKFESNRHPSPAKGYISTLAKHYLMAIIIPNALLGQKFFKYVHGKCLFEALNHCMTTGKSEKSTAYWDEIKDAPDFRNSIIEKWLFYVAGMKRDGSMLEESHRCYFDKYINLRCKSNVTKFRKGKTQDGVENLLARMNTEPELKTASHRKLMELGISDRQARLFMKARKAA